MIEQTIFGNSSIIDEHEEACRAVSKNFCNDVVGISAARFFSSPLAKSIKLTKTSPFDAKNKSFRALKGKW